MNSDNKSCYLLNRAKIDIQFYLKGGGYAAVSGIGGMFFCVFIFNK